MKFAFLLIDKVETLDNKASVQNGTAQIISVSSVQQACEVAKKLVLDGIDCIELCGAFGEEGARQVIKATANKIPIGYVVHLKEQDKLYNSVFGRD